MVQWRLHTIAQHFTFWACWFMFANGKSDKEEGEWNEIKRKKTVPLLNGTITVYIFFFSQCSLWTSQLFSLLLNMFQIPLFNLQNKKKEKERNEKRTCNSRVLLKSTKEKERNKIEKKNFSEIPAIGHDHGSSQEIQNEPYIFSLVRW